MTRFALLWLLLGVGLAGCGGGSSTPDPTGPVVLTPAMDETRAASATIVAADGGTLSATDARGNSFDLTIPPNALAQNTTITLTPLGALPGIPGGGTLLAGYEITPAGTTFAVPATVTVTIPPTDAANLFVFNMSLPEPTGTRAGAAAEPHDFYPGFSAFTCNNQGLVNTFELNVTRGLIQGVALGRREILDAILGILPTNTYSAMEARVWSKVQQAITGPCSDFQAAYEQAVLEEAVQTVGPALDGAVAQPSQFMNGALAYLGWRGIVQYLPTPLSEPVLQAIANGRDLLGEAADTLIEAQGDAKERHRFKHAVDLILLHQLLTIDVIESKTLFSDRNPEDVADLYAKFMTFKFEGLWEGSYQNNSSGFGPETLQMTIKWDGPTAAMRLPLERDPQILAGPRLNVESFEWKHRNTEEGSWDRTLTSGTDCGIDLPANPVPRLRSSGLQKVLPYYLIPGNPNPGFLPGEVDFDWRLCYRQTYLPPTNRQPFNVAEDVVVKIGILCRDTDQGLLEKFILDNWSAPQAATAVTTASNEYSGSRVVGSFTESATEKFTAVVKHVPR